MGTKIVCISDTHTKLHELNIPNGDIILHAGDALNRGNVVEFMDFIEEYSTLSHKYKIYVPGNHDKVTERDEEWARDYCEENGIIYLNNSGITIDGISFWGSAVTPRFFNWAWNRDSGTQGHSHSPSEPRYDPIDPYWDLIPKCDVLITHGPPYGFLDLSIYDGNNCGCEILLRKLKEIKPKYHVFGHIHHFGGQRDSVDGTVLINASVCDEQYMTVNPIQVIDYRG